MRTGVGQKLSVLDLYCGLGGLSLGFEMTGAFETLAAIDNYDWAVKTFCRNHPIKSECFSRPQDLAKLRPEFVLEALGTTPDVIIGGPPCQGFSHAGRRLANIEADQRNLHVFRFLQFVKSIKPAAFLMENVSGILTTGQNKRSELIEFLLSEYEAIGYKVSFKVLDSSEFRVPQRRKRLFIVGLLDGKRSFRFPKPPCGGESNLFHNPESFYTVADALSDLPTPKAEEPQDYGNLPSTNLQRFLRQDSGKLYNHLITRHSDIMIEKLRKQPLGTRLYPNWNHSWYRLDPSRPAPAVKENHRAPFVHFSEDRATSPRECARLQTIPDRYVLEGTKTAQLIMVGNAVPPILAAHLATELAKQCFGAKVPHPWTATNNPMIEKPGDEGSFLRSSRQTPSATSRRQG